MTYFIEQEGGTQTAKVKGAAGYTVEGSNCYTLDDARANGVINKELYDGFVNAIKNSFPQTGENVYKPEDFYIFRAADGNWNFALIKDVTNGDSSTATYSYEPNGAYTEKTTYIVIHGAVAAILLATSVVVYIRRKNK